MGDLPIPLEIKQKIRFWADAGSPARCEGLSKRSISYPFKFDKLKYNKRIAFAPDCDYAAIVDEYGDYELSTFRVLSFSSFVSHRQHEVLDRSWREDMRTDITETGRQDGRSAVQIDIPWEPPAMVRGIIGEGKSNIKVTGTRKISFTGRSEWEDNLVNTGTFKQSKFPMLQMEQESKFKVTGTIGSKITVEVDQDSKRNVELANTIKLRYKGEEEEILQTVEAGNTNLSLPNTQYLGYSQSVQGLFGIKATAKVGRLDLTMITSQEKGSTEKSSFRAGSKVAGDTLRDYEYLANTYFWLGPHQPNDSILTVELYCKGDEKEHPYGFVCVNPDGALPDVTPEEEARNEFAHIPFKRLEPTEFELSKLGWYVVLDRPLNRVDFLGAYIRYARYGPTGVDTLTVGNLSYKPRSSDAQEAEADTTLVLRLLKHNSPDTT